MSFSWGRGGANFDKQKKTQQKPEKKPIVYDGVWCVYLKL